MDELATQTGASRRSHKVRWIVFALLLLLAATVAMNLPRGYSDDLSKIGQGRAAVVLVRDNDAVESLKLMNVVNDIRGQYAGRVVFLLTDYDTPEGRAFMSEHKAGPVSLVLFDPSGKQVKVLSAPQTPASLINQIGTINGANS